MVSRDSNLNQIQVLYWSKKHSSLRWLYLVLFSQILSSSQIPQLLNLLDIVNFF